MMSQITEQGNQRGIKKQTGFLESISVVENLELQTNANHNSH